MRKPLPLTTTTSNRLSRWLLGVVVVLLTTVSAQAQLSGPKTIGTDYPTVAAAITALNAQGAGAGGVTFNVPAGYTETFASPTAGAITTTTGTAANPIVFQKSGTGANPVITAGVGTSTTADAIISLSGADYVTFNGIDLTDPTSNATATTAMEFGYLLGRNGAGATLDGTNNNSIRNGTITLQRAYTSTTNNTPYGIFSTAGTVAVPFTALSATSATATGQSSGNTFAGNTIQNVNGGIYLQGLADVAPYTNYDQNNTVGGTTAALGNTIQNYGGAAIQAYGIRMQYENNMIATYNTVNNAGSGGVASVNTLYGIYSHGGINVTTTLSRNTVTLVQAANSSQVAAIYNSTSGTGALTVDYNTISMTGNGSTGTLYNCFNSGAFTTASATVSFSNNTATYSAPTTGATNGYYVVYNSGALAATANVNNNTCLNAANTVASTGTVGFFYNTSNSTGAINFQNNQWTMNRTGASGSVYGYFNGSAATGAHTFSGNNFSNITLAGTSVFYGFYVSTTAAQLQTITGNTMTNIVGGSGGTAPLYIVAGASSSAISGNTVTGVSGTGVVYGIYTGANFYGGNVSGNTVGNVSSSGASSSVVGLYIGGTPGTAVNVSANKVYGISSSGATGVAYGVYGANTGTYTLTNNLIGGITASASTSLQGAVGVYLSSGAAANLYYNTIYLNNTSSGATSGSTGLYLGTTTTTLDARNNIVVNTSTSAGTGGYTSAFSRVSGTAGTAPANYATTSNTNLFYAGTPSATNLLYVEGTITATNAQQTLAAYKTFMATRDQNSVTENPPFVSTTGTATTFLHISTATATQVESGGTPVSGITTDYDGDTRNTSTPDIGADEGTFLPSDQTPPVITYTPLGNTSTTTSRTLVVTITDASGLATGTGVPRIYYRSGTSGTYFSAVATTVSGSSYTFTINYANIGGTPAAGTTIQYYVAAQDASAGSYVSTSPSGGSGTNPPGSTAPTTPNSYQVLPVLNGTYYVTATVGSSPTPAKEFATLTAAVAAYNSSGLGSAVSFVLLDASYSTAETFPITLTSNPDASATNTLTIRPGTGVTTTIAGSVATGAVLKLNGADYVTIDGSNAGTTSQNLTITNTSATGSGNAVLWLAAASTTDGATFNTVKNTNLTGTSSTGTPQFVVFLGGGGVGVTAPTTSTPIANSNNTLSNNLITKGFYGVFVYGVSATSLDQGNTITGNQLGQPATGTGFGQEGLRMVYQQSPTITGNEIQSVTNGTTTSNLYGIFLADCKGAVVSRNSVHNFSYTGTGTTKVWGIEINTNTFNTATNASAHRIDDNLVYALNSTAASGTWNTIGISANGGYGDQFYYNTVYLSGQLSAAGGTGGSAAFANGNPSITTPSTNIDVRNNIFSIIGGTGGTTATPIYANYNYAATYAGSTLNYNDLYVTTGATGLAVIGHLTNNGSPTGDYATLALWQAATGQEANSVSVDPQFTQTTTVPYNLTPGNIALNNVGTPLAGVTTDYTGATHSTTPDIGAIEFTLVTVDLAAAALVAPATSSTCYSTTEPVSVSVRNTGITALNFASNPATITVVVTLPGGTTQTLTTTLTTGTLAVGATQTVTLPTTLNMTTVGTYSFAITATVTGDQNTSNDVLTPAPTRTVVAPVAGTLTPASSAICLSGTATLTLTGAASGSIQYQSSPDNVTFTDVAGATSATYTTPTLTTTTYYRAQVRCNTNTATSNVSTVTVNNPQVASTNSPVAVCTGNTATLTATPATGSSVRFFSAATGGTALATGTSYTTPALTANTTYYAEAFTGGAERVGPVDNTFGAGGGLASTYAEVFNVTTAGTLTGVYAYPTAVGTSVIQLLNSAGTVLQTYTATFTATDLNVKTFVPLNFPLAVGTGFQLVNSSTSTATLYRNTAGAAATYTSTNGSVTITGNTFGTAGYYYFFYDWTLNAECVGTTRTAIQVNVVQPGTASFPANMASTCGTTGYQLAGTIGGGATTGTYTTNGTGTFSPNATTLTATYTPSQADITAGSVTITLMATTAACAAATATLALSISPAPVATFSYPAGTYCTSSSASVAPTLPSGATAGTFTASPAGLSVNAATGVVTLSSSAAGTYTVTKTVAASGPCASTSATATITVTPQTTAGFSYSGSPFCQSASNPTPTITGTAGGTFSAPTALSINASTGVINLSGSTAGTYTVTYTVSGACGSSSTQSVTISNPSTAGFSYATATTCAGAAATKTPTLATGTTSGTFTLPAATGLAVNATTGVVTISATAAAGIYTVTNTVAANGGCAAVTNTASFTITPQTTAGFSYTGSPFCVSGTNPTPSISGTAGGTFTSTTGLTVNATTGVITLSSSTPGAYTVTYTVAGTCGSSSTQSVTINAAPTAGFSYAAGPYCASGTNNPTVTLTAGATMGTFSSTTGLTINAMTGTITLSTSTPGAYTVTNTVAAANGCASVTSTASVTINAAPTAGFSYPSGTVCVGSSTTLTATPATGATAGTFTLPTATGLTINATTGAVTVAATAAAGIYTVTNTVAAANGCAAVTSTASFTLSSTSSTAFSYSGSPFCTTGTNPTPTITGTAGGTFSSTTGLTINASTGAITLSSSAAGTYTVTYTVSGACGGSSTQSVAITAPPTANIGYGATSYCTTTTGTVALGIGTGSTLGTITANPATGLTIAANGTITPSTSTPGTYFITNTVAASGGCAAVTGGTTVVIVAPGTAGFSYPATTACAGTATSLTPTLASGATAGTFTLPTATGLSINATTGAVTVGATAVASTYTVTNTVAASGGCAAVTSTATFTLTPQTTATFSYSGSPFCVSGTANPTPTVTGTAGGTFSSTTGLTINATTGVITLSSSTPGTYTVTYTVAGACGSSATQSVIINAAPTAGFSYATPGTGAACAGGTGTFAPILVTGATAGAFSSTTGLSLNAMTGVISLAGSTAGTYTITNTVAASGGCAAVTSTTTFTVNPIPATPTLAVSGTPVTGITLTSSSATGNQFYLNGVAVTGATSQTYLVNSGKNNGSYTVVVTGTGGCSSATSAAVAVTVTATATAATLTKLTVYPNPTRDGYLTLELSGYREAVAVTVVNAVGQRVYEGTISGSALTQKQTLNLSELATGVYLLQARTASGGVEIRRFVRE
ncbi:MAG: T9SS type A sorting domain-containing protein [Janthinobacterium lividum]